MYCRYCGKILTTADNLDRCYPSCPESLERKTGLMIPLQPDDYITLIKERDALRAENERLRKILENIITTDVVEVTYRDYRGHYPVEFAVMNLQQLVIDGMNEVKECQDY